MPLEELDKLGIEQISETTGMTSFQNTLLQGSKKTLGAASLFIATTSVMDFAVSAKRNKEKRHQIEQQEKRVQRKMKEENRMRKRIHKNTSVDSINWGETVFNMFEQRTGHHKMGNSK